jgi:hypothetical protein
MASDRVNEQAIKDGRLIIQSPKMLHKAIIWAVALSSWKEPIFILIT